MTKNLIAFAALGLIAYAVWQPPKKIDAAPVVVDHSAELAALQSQVDAMKAEFQAERNRLMTERDKYQNEAIERQIENAGLRKKQSSIAPRANYVSAPALCANGQCGPELSAAHRATRAPANVFRAAMERERFRPLRRIFGR